jgi:hypothetical protein
MKSGLKVACFEFKERTVAFRKKKGRNGCQYDQTHRDEVPSVHLSARAYMRCTANSVVLFVSVLDVLMVRMVMVKLITK